VHGSDRVLALLVVCGVPLPTGRKVSHVPPSFTRQ
jgi:hypothetical protein